MKCAQCQLDYDADDLVYNDYLGADVCDDCDQSADEEAQADAEFREESDAA